MRPALAYIFEFRQVSSGVAESENGVPGKDGERERPAGAVRLTKKTPAQRIPVAVGALFISEDHRDVEVLEERNAREEIESLAREQADLIGQDRKIGEDIAATGSGAAVLETMGKTQVSLE